MHLIGCVQKEAKNLSINAHKWHVYFFTMSVIIKVPSKIGLLTHLLISVYPIIYDEGLTPFSSETRMMQHSGLIFVFY